MAKEIETMQCSPDNLETLTASFDQRDWDLYIQDAMNIDELTDIVTEKKINFRMNRLIPKKTIKLYKPTNPGFQTY